MKNGRLIEREREREGGSATELRFARSAARQLDDGFRISFVSLLFPLANDGDEVRALERRHERPAYRSVEREREILSKRKSRFDEFEIIFFFFNSHRRDLITLACPSCRGPNLNLHWICK